MAMKGKSAGVSPGEDDSFSGMRRSAVTEAEDVGRQESLA